MSVDVVVQKYHYHSENTAQGFIKYAVNFPQVRLHLSHARQKIAFFVLHCIRFALTFYRKLGCTSAMQSKKLLFCFALHSVCTNFAAN